ncbi:UNVERIFIED_CONTAM: hypothetical protein Sradi_3008700 [Sesamum radiatum]|uniref:Uncharacterized protein n=1 Tax=Sesamum radiatum TaxID=300843 RepID=A0AAW2S146_SESRA
MAELGQCLLERSLTTMPMKGSWFSWHNFSEEKRNLWKRLDWVLSNEACWRPGQIASIIVVHLGPRITPLWCWIMG